MAPWMSGNFTVRSRKPLRRGRRSIGFIVGVLATCAYGAPAAKAQESQAAGTTAAPQPDSFHELETKYIFGFTSGADIGVPGEQAVELETTTASRKRGGHYSVIEQEIELERVPSDRFSYEFSAHVTSTAITGVEDLGDRHRVGFSGLSADFRFPILYRGPESRFGLTFKASPEWARIDGGTGEFTTAFASTFALLADTEIIPNRLYAAVNLGFAPEVSRTLGNPTFARASSTLLTGALAYRIAPKVTVGGEVEYYRAYEGLLFDTFDGHALYVGPTLHIQFTSKIMLSLAYSRQVAGHAVGDVRRLDLTDFEGEHANMKFEMEF